MGYGPWVVSGVATRDGLDVKFQFVTSLVNESQRLQILTQMAFSIFSQIGILAREDELFWMELEDWGVSAEGEAVWLNRKCKVEFLRQAEPAEPISADRTEDFNWHPLDNQSRPHVNILYEARLWWVN